MDRHACFAACLAAALAGAAPAGMEGATARAQKGDALAPGGALPDTEPEGEAWSVQCLDGAGGPPRCRAFQNMVVPGTGERLLTVVVEPQSPEPGYRLALALPHGLYLPAGVEIAIDGGEAARLVISTSDAEGAYAATEADEALVAAMKAGTTMNVSFVSATQQNFTVPVTLAGFAAAMRRLE